MFVARLFGGEAKKRWQQMGLGKLDVLYECDHYLDSSLASAPRTDQVSHFPQPADSLHGCWYGLLRSTGELLMSEKQRKYAEIRPKMAWKIYKYNLSCCQCPTDSPA